MQKYYATTCDNRKPESSAEAAVNYLIDISLSEVCQRKRQQWINPKLYRGSPQSESCGRSPQHSNP